MPPCLTLFRRENHPDRLHVLLQRGCLVPLAEPCALKEFLCSLPGFDESYVHERVQTIFINGQAEDDLDRQLVPGDALSLSGPMPGLAGAILRRGSRHAALRSQPVSTASTAATPSSPAQLDRPVRLKLFNVIAAEKGAELLSRGVLFPASVLVRAFDRQEELLEPAISTILLEDRPVRFSSLPGKLKAHKRIFLQVRS